MNNLMNEMEKLVMELNEASKAYYSEGKNFMDNKTYDAKYDKLLELERMTGVILPESPTNKVGYEVVSELKKVTHEYPALSLDKTKSREYLQEWLGNKIGVLSWKLDGLTGVATYIDGKLIQFATRGNGTVGEDVTHNARFIYGLPMHIPVNGKVIVRGEIVISYPDFNKINEAIDDPDERYKNPRNLASSSLRSLDSKVASTRHLCFKAFELVEAPHEFKTFSEALDWMECKGFLVVPNSRVNSENIIEVIGLYEKALKEMLFDFPSDGLVLVYDDVAYGRSLGTTGKFPKNAIAFKWADDAVETTLRDVEWSASRTGLINPVAVFDPVELCGTTVKRASIHNIRYMENLKLGYNDHISVYKANLIIPQIYENLTQNGDFIPVPETCPVCGQPTERVLSSDKESEFLYCKNPNCSAKHAGKFTRMVERDGLDIKGLSQATMTLFVNKGFIHEFADLYHLSDFKEEIIGMDGMGIKSYTKMMDAIEKSRETTSKQLLYALGIPQVGHDVGRILSKEIGVSFMDELVKLTASDNAMDFLSCMEGIGGVRAKAILDWFDENGKEYERLRKELTLADEEEAGKFDKVVSGKSLNGMTFVITGKLDTYPNRDALKAEIEARGGKVAGSVSKNTSYLINNDSASTTGKNKKALELGVPVITEMQFKEAFA